MSKIISPFTLTQESEKLIDLYPDSELLKDFFIKASESERFGIIRLWMTEGIPFAFKENPLLYEEIRSFIAKGINVNTKEVTLVGSGRIGYSLKKKVWGKKFSSASDLDFTVISNDLYSNLVQDYQKWVNDFRLKKIIPFSPEQTKNWLEAIATIDANIPNGFINTKNLFSNIKYPTVRKCNYTMSLLQGKLQTTANAPKISDVSVRVYSNWKSCVTQLQKNFKVALIW
ncbi:MAG: hypothetical protein HY062_12490 [Bacteroidetes bacterium]|nr:hypothetical protein [Bacteroidota bacterium]